MTVDEMIVVLREDFLSDTFDGWEVASTEERNGQFLWSDKALLRNISWAQKQACNRTNFLFDDSSRAIQITLKQGINEYVISPYITQIEEVDYNGKKVAHISREDRNSRLLLWRTATTIGDNQAFYMIRQRKLFIYPIPDSNDAGKTIFISAWHIPYEPIESLSDELVISEEYHEDLLWGVLYRCYILQDADGYDKDKGLGYLAQFNQAFGEYIPSEVRLNQLQEPESLRTRSIDYIGGSRLNRFGNDRENDAEWYR